MLLNKLCLLLLALLLSTFALAEDSLQYNQKTLQNGDIETTYASSDGTKMVMIQHQDGSVETTTTASDGTKSITIQRADGSVESHVAKPKES